MLWNWLLRKRGRVGLSAELSRTLAGAAELILSAQLTPREVRAVCRTAAQRLYQLPEAERSAICGHLELVERLVPLLSRTGRSFSALSVEGRRKCIQGCEKSWWPLLNRGHAQLRHLILMAYMDCHEAWPSSARPAPVA